jgi:hypothetical protein
MVTDESKLRQGEPLTTARDLTLVRSLASRHLLVLTLCFFALYFGLRGMDHAYLSIAEANTAQLGQNVLAYGYPRAWNDNFLVVPFYDGTINDQLAWVAHPWLQYYLAAGGIALFGPTNLGARFLFVLCGVLALPAIYFLTARMTASRKVVLLTTIIFALHPVIWLYERQSRYYAPTILLLVLVPLAYLRWRERPTAWRLIGFATASILLFHSLYTIWAFLMLGIGVFYLVFDRDRRTILQFSAAALVIGLLTLPWFLYAPPHFYFNQAPTLAGYGNRVATHLWKIQTLYYPLLSLVLIWLAIRIFGWFKNGRGSVAAGPPWPREYLLFLAAVVYVFFVLLYPFYTTHYMLPVLPFGAIVTAHLIANIRTGTRWLAGVILSLVLATNVLHILPFIVVDKLGINPQRLEAVMPNPTATMTVGTPLSHYLTEQLKIRFFIFDVYEFTGRERRHQLQCVVDYLKENVRQDQTVLTPWNDATALAFHTNLKVAYESESPFLRNERLKALLAKPSQPDWIVPLAIDIPGQIYNGEPFRSEYERVTVQCPKEYFETYPNLEFFNFRTNREAPSWFFILKKQEGNGYAKR